MLQRSGFPAPAPGLTEGPAGERSETAGPGGRPGAGAAAPPPMAEVVIADPEVPEKARRRQFSAGYKLRVLKEADACDQRGQLGELLRREGLYSSHLILWRRQREEGSLQSLSPRTRGRRPRVTNPLTKRVTDLERENDGLRKRLRQAELIIDVQKKVSQILGVTLDPSDDTGGTS